MLGGQWKFKDSTESGKNCKINPTFVTQQKLGIFIVLHCWKETAKQILLKPETTMGTENFSHNHKVWTITPKNCFNIDIFILMQK